jgi:Fe-S cluster biosynthesis and repair protein YggX
MALTCKRCGREGEPPPARRVGFRGAAQEQILASICGDCWKEWEGMEVKVMNEYRLNLMDPEHREIAKKQCSQFLGLEF